MMMKLKIISDFYSKLAPSGSISMSTHMDDGEAYKTYLSITTNISPFSHSRIVMMIFAFNYREYFKINSKQNTSIGT